MGIGRVVQLPPDHGLHQLFPRGARRVHLADIAAIPHHHDPVRDLKDLFHPVADVDDRHAGGLELADDVEEDVYLFHRQRRSRLVQDQHPGVEQHRLGDLHDLHHRRGQREQHGVGVDIRAEVLEYLPGLFHHLLFVDDHSVADQVAHEHILHDRQIPHQRELLVHRADPQLSGLSGSDALIRRPIHHDSA